MQLYSYRNSLNGSSPVPLLESENFKKIRPQKSVSNLTTTFLTFCFVHSEPLEAPSLEKNPAD